jgi:rhodanese-related sulfurtransferase
MIIPWEDPAAGFSPSGEKEPVAKTNSRSDEVNHRSFALRRMGFIGYNSPTSIPIPFFGVGMPRQPGRIKKAVKPGRQNRTGLTSKSARRVSTVALAIAAVLVIGFLIVRTSGVFAPWQLSEEISPTETRKQIDSGAIVVDVRTYDEYVAGHIDKSYFMPLEELTSLMQSLPHDRLIITVCRTGVRSNQARYILQNAGFSQVTSLKGGMEAWVAAGFPVVYGEPVRNN